MFCEPEYTHTHTNIYIYIYVFLEEIENKDKIKEILDTTKIIKSQRQPKNLKKILTSSTFGKTQPKELPNAEINDEKYVI